MPPFDLSKLPARFEVDGVSAIVFPWCDRCRRHHRQEECKAMQRRERSSRPQQQHNQPQQGQQGAQQSIQVQNRPHAQQPFIPQTPLGSAGGQPKHNPVPAQRPKLPFADPSPAPAAGGPPQLEKRGGNHHQHSPANRGGKEQQQAFDAWQARQSFGKKLRNAIRAVLEGTADDAQKRRVANTFGINLGPYLAPSPALAENKAQGRPLNVEREDHGRGPPGEEERGMKDDYAEAFKYLTIGLEKLGIKIVERNGITQGAMPTPLEQIPQPPDAAGASTAQPGIREQLRHLGKNLDLHLVASDSSAAQVSCTADFATVLNRIQEKISLGMADDSTPDRVPHLEAIVKPVAGNQTAQVSPPGILESGTGRDARPNGRDRGGVPAAPPFGDGRAAPAVATAPLGHHVNRAVPPPGFGFGPPFAFPLPGRQRDRNRVPPPPPPDLAFGPPLPTPLPGGQSSEHRIALSPNLGFGPPSAMRLDDGQYGMNNVQPPGFVASSRRDRFRQGGSRHRHGRNHRGNHRGGRGGNYGQGGNRGQGPVAGPSITSGAAMRRQRTRRIKAKVPPLRKLPEIDEFGFEVDTSDTPTEVEGKSRSRQEIPLEEDDGEPDGDFNSNGGGGEDFDSDREDAVSENLIEF